MKRYRNVSLLCLSLIASNKAFGGFEYNWIGDISGEWTNSSEWSGGPAGGYPGNLSTSPAGDDIASITGLNVGSISITTASAVNYDTLIISTDIISGTVTLLPGAVHTISAIQGVSSGATVGPLFIQTPVQADPDGLTVGFDSGTVFFSGGISETSPSTVTIDGDVYYTSPVTYSITNILNLNNLFLTGTATLNPSGTLTMGSQSNFDFSGGLSQTVANLSGSGTINTGSNTLTIANNSTALYSGAIVGAGGSFTKQGSGALTLAGFLTYDGTTELESGTLYITGPTALDSSSQVLIGGGELNLASYNGTVIALANLAGIGGGTILAGSATISIPMSITSTTFDGAFSASSASLVISGPVTNFINLTGNSSQLLQVNLQGATTAITTANSIGGPNVPITLSGGNLSAAGTTTTLNGTITFDTTAPALPVIGVASGSSLILSGTILQTGGNPEAFIKIGDGTLMLTNSANASPGGISGKITIGNGKLVAMSDSALGTAAASLVFGSSTTAVPPTLVAGGTISSTKPIELSDYAVFDTNGLSMSLAGTITGSSGFTKIGDGTLVLSGTNTSFTGIGTVSSGVLQIAIGDAVTNASRIVVGSVTSPATLQVGDSLLLTPEITVAAGGGIFDGNGFSPIFNSISGTGSVAIIGTGSISFLSGGTYTGATFVQQGTLMLVGTISSTTALDISAGATFDISFLVSPQQIGDLTGSGAVILSPSYLFTAGTTNSTTFSGAMGTITGGSFTKAGQGTLTLSGTLNYSGGTTIANGTLILTDNAITTAAAISNGEVLVFSPSDTRAFNWLITGSGSVVVQGTGSVSWTGLSPNTYSGTTSITSGTLELNMNISSGSAIAGSAINIAGGNLVLGSIAPSNQINSPSTNMALSAGMFNVGANQVTLGALNYSGGSIAGGGTINLAANGQALAISVPNSTIQSTISLATAGSTIVNNSSISTINNVIFNAGGSQISSTGNLVLNASSGGAFTLTSGTLTLNTGTHNYGASSPTLQSGSTLILQGDMTASALNVNAGATMQGTGTFNGSLNLQGSLTPGNSIGTINLSGAQTFGATSILVAEISNSSSSADLVNITGSLAIAPGATLQIVPTPSNFFNNDLQYTLVQTTGGITGTFIVDASSLLTGTLYDIVYTGSSIILNLQGLSLLNLVSQGNPGKVAQVLDSTVIAPGNDLFNVYQALLSITNIDVLIDALNQMQPSMLKGLLLAQENSSIRVQQGISLRMENLLSKACFQDINRLTLWTDGLGDYSHQSSKGLEPGLNSASGGLTLGVDYKATHGFGGLAASYTYSNVVWQEGRGLGNINSVYGSVYGGLASKHFYMDALFEASYNHYNEKRRIVFPGISRTARGHFNGGELLGHLELGGITRTGRFEFRPFISSEMLYLHAKAFHETGADSINLNLHSSNYVMLRSELGMNFSRCFPWDTYSMRIDGKLSYIREDRFQGSVFKTSFLSISDNFNVHGLNPDRNLFSPALSLAFVPRNQGAEFSLNYEGEFGSSFWDQNVRLQYGYRF